MEKAYIGTCHCKKVKFEANIDLSKGTGRCNCSFCSKVRNWNAFADVKTFKLLSDPKYLSDYQFSTESLNHHYFCKNCGVRTHTKGFIEQIGGDFISVSIAVLDDIKASELAALEIKYADGLNNNWWNQPEIYKHL